MRETKKERETERQSGEIRREREREKERRERKREERERGEREREREVKKFVKHFSTRLNLSHEDLSIYPSFFFFFHTLRDQVSEPHGIIVMSISSGF